MRCGRDDVDLDSYRIEGWQYLPRPFLERVIAKLRRRGIAPVLYFRAFVGQDEIGTDDPDAFDEAIDRGYVATRADGSPYVFNSNFNAPAAQIDFTDPAAVRWWKGRIRSALRLGAEGFMQDFGEQVQVDMHFDDGSTGATMHNRLPVLFHRATWQAVRAFERHHPNRHVFYFTRSGYTGTPGAARWEFANFPGDESTDWSRSAGLASLTTDMLNRGIGGAYGFTTDIGGFFDIPYGATSRELFIRWAQWSALSPMFRVHGSVASGTHTPWSYDAETLRIYKRLAALHERAEPLIMRLWRKRPRDRDADRAAALAPVPGRSPGRRAGSGMDAGQRCPRRPGGRGGRSVAARLLPPRLLAGPGRSPPRRARLVADRHPARTSPVVQALRDRSARLSPDASERAHRVEDRVCGS